MEAEKYTFINLDEDLQLIYKIKDESTEKAAVESYFEEFDSSPDPKWTEIK